MRDRPPRSRGPARSRRPKRSMRAAITSRPADQDRPGDALVEHHLHRAQHALVLALGVDHALGLGAARLANTGLMMKPERKTKRAELLGDRRRSRRSAASRRRSPSPPSPPPARCAGSGADRTGWGSGTRGRTAGLRRHRRAPRRRTAPRAPARRSPRPQASFIASLIVRRADVERAAEDVGKAQDVVDLVGIVGAAGADHRVGPRRERQSPA